MENGEIELEKGVYMSAREEKGIKE